MCIVIDASAIPAVFNPNHSKHFDFSPVLDWIVKDRGKMVYGGEKYKRELSKLRKYWVFIIELKRAGKIVAVRDDSVDERQRLIEQKENCSDFDDPHIVAIVGESGCKLVCTDDKRSRPFLKRRDLYPRGVRPPRLYTRKQNSNLLCCKNIAKICLPSEPSVALSKGLANIENSGGDR